MSEKKEKTEYYPSGKIKCCQHWIIEDGDQIEIFESYHENGQIAERWRLRDNIPHGLQEAWNVDGLKIFHGVFANGKYEGLCEERYQNGNLMSRAIYKDGKIEGLFEKGYENGHLRKRANYKDGKLDGLSQCWHENGKLSSKINFKGDKLDGLCELWDEDGELFLSTNFKEDKPEGPAWGKDEKGDTVFRVNFKGGKLDGMSEWLEKQRGFKVYYHARFKNGKPATAKDKDFLKTGTLFDNLGIIYWINSCMNR